MHPLAPALTAETDSLGHIQTLDFVSSAREYSGCPKPYGLERGEESPNAE